MQFHRLNILLPAEQIYSRIQGRLRPHDQLPAHSLVPTWSVAPRSVGYFTLRYGSRRGMPPGSVTAVVSVGRI
jgi:hypothetical protein